MIAQSFLFALLVAVASAGLLGGYGLEGGLIGGGAVLGGGIAKSVDYYAPPKYEFKYGVEDAKTGDLKERTEVRVGDVLKSQYAWAEPDRVVKVAVARIGAQPAVVVAKGGIGY